MRVDVVDLRGSKASVLQRGPQASHLALRCRHADVVRVAGHPVADQVAVDHGAACTRMVLRFQHQERGAFAEHQS